MFRFGVKYSTPGILLLTTTVLFFIYQKLVILNDGSFVTIVTSTIQPSSVDDNISKICLAAWPRLEIFLPLAPSKESVIEFTHLFLPAWSLFWPWTLPAAQTTSFLIITDEEARNNFLIDEMRKLLVEMDNSGKNRTRLTFNSLPGYRQLQNGHDRQQWLMFWADNFTTADYVGFIDSDSIFVTRVTLMDLFDMSDSDNPRPIVRPLYGMPQGQWWVNVPRMTEFATGRKSAFSCMTFFPVIIKVAHLPLIREHVRRHLNAPTFDEAFLSIIRDPQYSQFDIFCAYLWYYRRNDYVWAIGQRNPHWRGPVPPGQVNTMAEAGITSADLAKHGPHLAIHWTHESTGLQRTPLASILKMGVCFSMMRNDPKRPNYCNEVMEGKDRFEIVNAYEWTFETHLLTNRDNLNVSLAAHQQRLTTNDQCPHAWNFSAISATYRMQITR